MPVRAEADWGIRGHGSAGAAAVSVRWVENDGTGRAPCGSAPTPIDPSPAARRTGDLARTRTKVRRTRGFLCGLANNVCCRRAATGSFVSSRLSRRGRLWPVRVDHCLACGGDW